MRPFCIAGELPGFKRSLDNQNVDDQLQTYYVWLQADPERWSAVNAWLSDPAIVAELSDSPLNGTTMADRVGDTSRCVDPAAAGIPQ